MRFIDLYENNRPLGKHDVPDEVASSSGRSFQLHGATRMGGNGVVFEATELQNRKPTGSECAVKVLKQLS